MKMKTTFLTFGLLITTALTFGQTKSVSDYFMFKEGIKFTYKAMGVDGTGKIPEMSYQCISVKNENGGIKGSFYENTQWGSQNQQMYLAKGSEVQLIYTKNAFSGGDVNPPNTVLKLPSGNSEISWTWGDTRYSAQYIASVTTKTKTYNDIVVVTEGTKPEYKMGTKKKYYAKGIGLVKIEFYDENDKLSEMMSFELVKYE